MARPAHGGNHEGYCLLNRGAGPLAGFSDVDETSNPTKKLELYRPSDRRLLAKLVPTFADRGCRVVSATDSHGR
jgi:hypothetical protein